MLTFFQVLLLFVLVSLAVIGAILAICWLGGRNVGKHLDANLRDGYVPRIGDHPSQRYARRREDQMRSQFLAECE